MLPASRVSWVMLEFCWKKKPNTTFFGLCTVATSKKLEGNKEQTAEQQVIAYEDEFPVSSVSRRWCVCSIEYGGIDEL